MTLFTTQSIPAALTYLRLTFDSPSVASFVASNGATPQTRHIVNIEPRPTTQAVNMSVRRSVWGIAYNSSLLFHSDSFWSEATPNSSGKRSKPPRKASTTAPTRPSWPSRVLPPLWPEMGEDFQIFSWMFPVELGGWGLSGFIPFFLVQDPQNLRRHNWP